MIFLCCRIAGIKASSAKSWIFVIDSAEKSIRWDWGHQPQTRLENEKHEQQWANTLATYASPVFGNLPVGQIKTALVMRVLEPIWASKTETASRVRGRIEKVLDWCKTQGYRLGENPARWKGHLENLLSTPKKTQAVEHHPALPWREVGAFMRELRKMSGSSALALCLFNQRPLD